MHNSEYEFTCGESYWLDGTNRMVCEYGKWHPPVAPVCRPMPCNTLPCINGGTCSNIDTQSYRCHCTNEWHGSTCARRTVNKDTLTAEIRAFVKRSGDACKSEELFSYLGESNLGRYPSYKWTVLCLFKSDSNVHLWFSRQVILVEFDRFLLWVGWQDKYSAGEILLQYYLGKIRAKNVLSNMDLGNCNAHKIGENIMDEFGKVNMNFMAMVITYGGYSYYGSELMIVSYHQAVNCPKSKTINPFNLGALLDVFINEFTLKQGKDRHIIVIGAEEMIHESMKRAIQLTTTSSACQLNGNREKSESQLHSTQNLLNGDKEKGKARKKNRRRFQ